MGLSELAKNEKNALRDGQNRQKTSNTPYGMAKNAYFCNMKIKINWRRLLLFLTISAGLLYVTQSALMAIGILLLLFVADHLLADYADTQARKKNNNHGETGPTL